MAKKPFPFSVCEQCCNGDVSDEQIKESVVAYMEENPITADDVEIADGVPISEEFASLNRHLDDVNNDIGDISKLDVIQYGLTNVVDAVLVQQSYVMSVENKTVYNAQDIATLADTKLSETILHHYIVDTPVWSIQPTVDGELLGDFKTTDFYYVTRKNTDGTALPSGQFKLMPFYNKYAEAYEQIFYRSTVPSENFPVEFKEIGANFKMRDAGEMMSKWLGINKNFKNDIKQITAIVNGSFIQLRPDAYYGLIFNTNGSVSTYNIEPSVWSQDSGNTIWHWHSYPSSYKENKYFDKFTIERCNESDYISTRDGFLRYRTYGSSTWAHRTNRTIGFGKLLSDTVTITSALAYGVNDSGYLRNGTEITVKEVK